MFTLLGPPVKFSKEYYGIFSAVFAMVFMAQSDKLYKLGNVPDIVGTKPRKAAKSRILTVILSATIQSLF